MKTSALVRCLAVALILALPRAASAAEPFYEGLGSHSRQITTSSAEAQKYFNQGLRLLYGFNHGSAIRSFKAAVQLDPACAMAHWGIALASGPDINSPVVPLLAAERAWQEISLAREHAAAASPVEQALIAALSARYANPQPADRSGLDRAYADAMRGVWKKFPTDTDVGVLFAEAMMDLRPWDQWTPEGLAQPGTNEIIATLEAVLKLDINHPFANHLYIHALEASPNPGRAGAAADRLLTLQPGLAHNEHMLAYAAMMAGRSALALEHIKAMVDGLPLDYLEESGMEFFVAMPYEVMIRFGKWDDILAAPDHPEWAAFSRAIRRATRGIAFAATGDAKAARGEQAEFFALAKLVPAEAMAGNNTSRQALGVATPMLEGEILYREGKVDAALAKLREAVAAEDALKYDEPPGWLLPVRHSLGATLMQERRYAEAEQVYRADLARLPEDGWALFGLSEALRFQRKHDEASGIDERFKRVWAKADVRLRSSCYCQPGV